MIEPQLVLGLPPEAEIESIHEVMVPETTGLIKRTVRYKSGLTIVLLMDFRNIVFQICVKPYAPLWLSRNQILAGTEF
jgi:hypothetical protein